MEPLVRHVNRLNRGLVEEHPDKSRVMVAPVETRKGTIRGGHESTYDRAAEELDELLENDTFVGIGEGLPTDPTVTEHVPWLERKKQIGRYRRRSQARRSRELARGACDRIFGQ